MPSDEIDTRILEVLAQPVGVFESSLAATDEQVRAAVEAQQVSGSEASGNGKPRDAGAELGAFATARMDTERFASLLLQSEDVDDMTRGRIQDAHATLTDLLGKKNSLLRVDVAPGGSLRDTVAKALAEIGRAFGAARMFDLARAGRFQPGEHDGFAHAFEFERWSRSERECAPPLIVHVDGADLRAGGLLEFLDGALKIVLVVRGAATAAPLIPLVRRNAFVMQTSDAADLARFAAWDGTGVAALVPEGAARFVHDPDGGGNIWDRLTVEFTPGKPRAALGGYSIPQQAEDLEQLATLAEKPPEPVAPVAPVAPASAPAGAAAPVQAAEPGVEPADRLAAWLLDQANLEGTA